MKQKKLQITGYFFKAFIYIQTMVTIHIALDKIIILVNEKYTSNEKNMHILIFQIIFLVTEKIRFKVIHEFCV